MSAVSVMKHANGLVLYAPHPSVTFTSVMLLETTVCQAISISI